VIPVKVKLMKLVFMVGEGFGRFVVVRLPDWFIADVRHSTYTHSR
jgi:hypothetical protein